ncbi:(2Fe-2S)-binding protein [Natronospirillum operosum]|uniref:Bacterioferritin-associated ferredoxin n=2 Tax=Natronospirillum operosum TaxID=2759953 RepID=A0A4Z0WER7_9GAMM|nr:(2Fe-2S)-binding protein [Natronospirillum operosum]
MYVCLCNAITDQQITTAVSQGQVNSMRDLQREFGVGTCCGKCARDARDLLDAARPALPEPTAGNLFYSAASAAA